MDKLKAMSTFVAIVDQGSLSAAGDKLDRSPAAIVRTLAGLERHLGVRLLNRSTRRLALTDEGRDYLQHCRQILADIHGAEARLDSRRTEPAGTLSITAPVMFGHLHLTPLLNQWLKQHPQMRADLTLLDRVTDLLEEGFDLALRIGDLDESSLMAKRLGRLALTLCAAPDYLAEHGTPAHPRDLARHRCLDYSYARHGLEWQFRDGDTPVRVRPQPGMRANSGEVLRDVAIAGGGITMQPDFMLGTALASGALIELLPDYAPPRLGLYALYPNRTLMPTKLRTLLDHFQSAFAALTDPETGLLCTLPDKQRQS